MKRTIDFLITQKCNYRCEYCSQSKKFVSNNLEEASRETIDAFLGFLKTLTGEVEVTISGGEPLIHPDFFYTVNEICKLGYKISIVSNFSFPIESYKKIKDVAGENLSGLLISLHTGQVKNIDDYLKKAEIFNHYKENTDFSVAAVLTDENCAVLKQVYSCLTNLNIKFELQHMRIGNRFVDYNKEASDFIKTFPVSKIKEKSHTFAFECSAGRDFMIVYQNGEAYRCYSSRFNKIHSMGNIKDKDFKMFSNSLPCLNKNCTCPKPIMLNMIDFSKDNYPLACILSLYNAVWLPYYGVKNFKILKAKLLQFLNFKNRG
ncbi:MAG: radical SAM protein [Candidatus Gastranaerophilales bacterium]|nr:radical SAM protein [Candidatus Gastranaerophilales bacterium]